MLLHLSIGVIIAVAFYFYMLRSIGGQTYDFQKSTPADLKKLYDEGGYLGVVNKKALMIYAAGVGLIGVFFSVGLGWLMS